MSQTGTVKWFDAKKGYGFIILPDGKDLFVHFSAIEAEGFKTLYQGDVVQYDIVDGKNGAQASKVVVVEKAPRKHGRKGESGTGEVADDGDDIL